ncbi:unnamed protein product [Clonostachys rosea]|uniref:SRR1-like domain-containing protein n=1 Tax=Bionectria ochroleuca TaxID=29856 RepID=A0ABY6UC84_BIOOC|nr:unnamed protein product [Clonostachys rosea]
MADRKIIPAPTNPLLLREIVAEVMKWIDMDYGFSHEVYSGKLDEYDEPEVLASYGKDGVLARCCCVNRLWFNEAAPLLWAAPTQFTFAMDQTLSKMLDKLDMSRRQLYANFVKEAVIAGVPPDDAFEHDEPLKGLDFPKLESVDLPLAGWGESEYIPRIKNHRVKILAIDPSFDIYPDTYRVMQNEMGSILDQIPVRIVFVLVISAVFYREPNCVIQEIFPDLENVDIIDCCLAAPGAIEKCESRLPKLKYFGRGPVVVGNDYPASLIEVP